MYINSMDGYSEWQCNAETVQENRMPYACHFIPYSTPQEAAGMNPSASSRILLHNGKWRFRRFDSDSFALDFAKAESNSQGWDTVELPFCYNTDMPVCENQYPWEQEEECAPPYAPTVKNSVGCYTRIFNLQPQYAHCRIILALEGVSSAFYLYVNGERVGFSKNAFCTARFDITEFLQPGRNLLAIEVHTFSTASWLDGEEAWRLAGIFRDVYIYYTQEHSIEDFTVLAQPDSDLKDASLNVQAKIAGNTDGALVELTVMDGANQIAAFDQSFVKSSGDVKLKTTVAGVKLWNSETPNLYKVILTLKCDSLPVESVAFFAGFRRLEIKGGMLKLNGQRIVLKGINLKECNGKRPYTKQELEHAVLEMKRANINALRTPYHPADSYLYDLCDQYGIYVIDENNIFSAYTKPDRYPGGAYLPGSRGEWTALCRDRAAALYQRDKNHACIIGWAVNDPSGGGNGVLMREYLEDMDSSRFLLVDTEGGPAPGGRSFVTAFTPQSPLQLEQYLATHANRPILLTNFAHCAGNACGSLENYISLFYNYPSLQGGFLADWNDLQSAVGYTPVLDEIRAQYSSIAFSPVYPARGCIDLTNHYDFSDLSDFTICWKAVDETGVRGQGFLVVCAPAGSTIRVELPIPADLTNEWYLHVYALTVKETPWTPKGAQAAFRQFVINAGRKAPFLPAAGGPALIVTENYAAAKVSCEDFDIRISRRTGLLYDFNYRGKKLLYSPVLPNFWRAPTDQERKNHQDILCAAWKYAGDACTGTITDVSIAPDNSKVVIETQLRVPVCQGSFLTCTYTIQSGEIRIHFHYLPPKHLPAPPAAGLRFILSDTFTDTVYLGNGPQETYRDRYSAAPIGRYSESWLTINSPYGRGQEFGNHYGVRYAEMMGSDCTLRLEGQPAFEFSLLPYSHEELENGIPSPQHRHPHLTIYAWQNGVGENAYDSSATVENSREYCLDFSILPMMET